MARTETQHPYVYGYANPARYADPTGEESDAIAALLWITGFQAGYQVEYERQMEELTRAGQPVYLNPANALWTSPSSWRFDVTQRVQPAYVPSPKLIDYEACARAGLETANAVAGAYVGGVFLKECAGAGVQALALGLFGSDLLQR